MHGNARHIGILPASRDFDDAAGKLRKCWMQPERAQVGLDDIEVKEKASRTNHVQRSMLHKQSSANHANRV